MAKHRPLVLLVVLLVLPVLACGFGNDDVNQPPRNALVIDVMANTSLNPWLEQAAAAFNEQELESDDGQTIWVNPNPVDAGQAVIDIAAGSSPDLWIPDQQVWVDVLAEQGQPRFQSDCVSVAQSPLVIAMWRPLAESLGYPGRDLGWLDIGSLAADPGAWAYYSGGRFGDALRLGHTHPGLSASGTNTLLAVVQAAESKTEPVSVSDIERPIVQASVGAFESAVSWFSSSTGDLAATMSNRGVDFLGAAVLYESDVLYYGRGEPDLVPVYPFEGTFVADHPACVNSESAKAGAALRFRDYLLTEEAQQMAVSVGLRPVNEGVPAAAPLVEANGVDLEQPAAVFEPPTVDSVFAVQQLWQSARKPVNLVMLLDVSGSMSGPKIENVRQAAAQFVEQMGEEDYLSIIAFASEPMLLVRHQQVGEDRTQIINAIQSLDAEGDTSLYDAIGDGAMLLEETDSPNTTPALMVLSDGLDTYSVRYDENSAAQAVLDAGATAFTIAYGSDADEQLMRDLAFRANGNYFLGSEASIASIYEEMSAAFGGSVGVGR